VKQDPSEAGKLMYTLYFAPSTCSLATHIALIDAGAAYELKRINFKTIEQQSDAYRAVNPKARVPALATPRGVLTETPAMLAYLAQSYPAADLAPLDDPFAFAEMQAFNSYLCSTVHVAHAHRMRGYRWADDSAALEAMKKKVPQSVGDSYELIERNLFRGPWVMGERYSVADPYLFTLAQWMEGDGVRPADYPRVAEHRDRMAKLPNVRQALKEEAPF
jgi:glutathione S-transferase